MCILLLSRKEKQKNQVTVSWDYIVESRQAERSSTHQNLIRTISR